MCVTIRITPVNTLALLHVSLLKKWALLSTAMTLSDYIEYRGAPWPAVVDFVLNEVGKQGSGTSVRDIRQNIEDAWGVTREQFRAFLEDYRKEWLKDIPRK